MKKLQNYIPFHFVVCLIVGIITQFYTSFWQFGFSSFFLFFLFLVLILYVFHRYQKRVFFSLTTYVFFFFIGVAAVFFQDARNYENYYANKLEKEFTAVFTVDKVLKSGNYYDKYQVEVSQINQQKSSGHVLLNIKKDSTQQFLQVDEQLFLVPFFKKMIPPLNPHQFSYQDYLAKQGIHHQVFTENPQFKKLGKRNFSFNGIAYRFRKKIQESLLKYPFKHDEYAVINALLLGQRQEISKELIADYSKAGAIHILAVSGLHIGIIMLILSLLLKPIEKMNNGKIVKTVFIILLLWMFAFIAGLSASVVRAVTMFTFVAVGQSFQRKQFVEFSLLTSMFFLLLVKPMFLFDVGFQLSYLAVFGIVWVQPKMYDLCHPKWKIVDKFWQLFTVSVSAQFGILPLSLYYFHQFPGLFILSNLVVIPFLGFILIGGILVMILAILGILPVFLAKIYGFVIYLMNHFVSWVSHQEQFLFKEISMSLLLMLVFYGCIVLGYQFFIQKNTKKLLYFLGSILLLQSVLFLEKYNTNHQREFIVFHKSRKAILGNRIGDTLQVFHNLDTVKIKQQKLITAYKIGEESVITFQNKIPNIFQINHKNIVIIDSLGVYPIKIKHLIIVLQHSPKINIKRMLYQLKPIQIIADGSNYKSDVLRWKKTCKENQIPFYYTGSKGAIVIR